MKRVLVIKNKRSLAKKIVSGLTQAGDFTFILHNEHEGLHIAFEKGWDTIILDWDALTEPGPQICRKIREHSTTPIIIVTNHSSVQDCIDGLKSGADDFIRKPFAKEELVARIYTILRRMNDFRYSVRTTSLQYKDIFLDVNRQMVKKGEVVLSLTRREYDLLFVLMNNKNKVLSREILLNRVWGDVVVSPNVVDLYIGYLRNKLHCKKNARYIKTIHGRGYSMQE